MDIRTLKDSVYSEMADVTKALGNAHRLEILDLLAQGACSVEYIANNTNLSIANASQHLQVLKHSKLVVTKRRGKYHFYRLANDHVFNTWCALRRLALAQNSEISQLLHDFQSNREYLDTISTEELIQKMDHDDLIVIDVRPQEEYEKGHIQNAFCFPMKSLRENMKHLDKDKKIVAYCRGPLCMLADEAVEMLNQQGYRASRLENGYPDWKARDLPIEDKINQTQQHSNFKS